MPAAPPSVPWSWSVVRRGAAAALVCLSVGAALGYALTHERGAAERATAPATRKHAGPAELALVSPLREGDSLEGYTVASLDAVQGGAMGVVLARGGDTVRLEIVLADPASPPAPAAAGRYAVYFDVHGAPPPDAQKLATALARVVGANAAAPPPPGLAPFDAHAPP